MFVENKKLIFLLHGPKNEASSGKYMTLLRQIGYRICGTDYQTATRTILTLKNHKDVVRNQRNISKESFIENREK